MLDLEAALNAANEALADVMLAAEADPDLPDLTVQSLQKAHDTVDRLSRNYPHFKMRSEIQRRLTA
jgi:phage shock protein A